LLVAVATAQELGESKAAIPAMVPNAMTGFMAAPEHHSDKEAEDVAESLLMDDEVQKDAKATDTALSKRMQRLIGEGKEAAAKVLALEQEKKVLQEEAIEEATSVKEHEEMLAGLQKAIAKERADERASKAPKKPAAPAPAAKKQRPEKMQAGKPTFKGGAKGGPIFKAGKRVAKSAKGKKLVIKLKKPVTSNETATETAANDLERLNKKVRDPASKAKDSVKGDAGGKSGEKGKKTAKKKVAKKSKGKKKSKGDKKSKGKGDKKPKAAKVKKGKAE